MGDESLSFPPAREKRSMDGGKVGEMSGFSSEQHLQGLERILKVRRKTQKHNHTD